ncbi:MAG TPA: hypothetical protein VK463_01085 [Desulfomonilaceae bacterium]|nr:hypothetical protein [Desulfomonilaceae bacterium]
MLFCRDKARTTLSGRGSIAAVRLAATLAAAVLTCSCTLLTHSPYICQRTDIPLLKNRQGLITSHSGQIPYQRWRIPPWDEEMRYCWVVGNYDFRKFDQVEIVLYFHGMHSKDYYPDFRRELDLLKEKRPDRPFLFVGFVDTPYFYSESRGKERWTSLVPESNERPDRLFKTVNRLYKSLRGRFPHIKKEKTTLVLAGFSGGGRVLDSVGNWLAKADKADPYGEVFRSRLSKIVYFDCWFDKNVVHTVPALLEGNPEMKIVGTVHMKKPLELATILAEKYKMKADRNKRQLVGLDGRLTIFRNDSHWSAIISRLREAL